MGSRKALRQLLTLSLSEETIELLKALSEEQDLPRGRIIDRLVRVEAEQVSQSLHPYDKPGSR